jgi:hypothetical protein
MCCGSAVTWVLTVGRIKRAAGWAADEHCLLSGLMRRGHLVSVSNSLGWTGPVDIFLAAEALPDAVSELYFPRVHLLGSSARMC